MAFLNLLEHLYKKRKVKEIGREFDRVSGYLDELGFDVLISNFGYRQIVIESLDGNFTKIKNEVCRDSVASLIYGVHPVIVALDTALLSLATELGRLDRLSYDRVEIASHLLLIAERLGYYQGKGYLNPRDMRQILISCQMFAGVYDRHIGAVSCFIENSSSGICDVVSRRRDFVLNSDGTVVGVKRTFKKPELTIVE